MDYLTSCKQVYVVKINVTSSLRDSLIDNHLQRTALKTRLASRWIVPVIPYVCAAKHSALDPIMAGCVPSLALAYVLKILRGTVKITWVPCPGADWISQLPPIPESRRTIFSNPLPDELCPKPSE